MASHNLQNGVLPNQQSHSQHVDQFKSAVANNDPRFNGVHSAQSSRSASPSTSSTRLQQIPSAQLPPSARNIPATQLPPSSRSPINLAQNMGQMTLNTPSTGVSARFSTSTPNQGENSFRNSSSSGVFSPITPLVPKPVTVQQQNGQNPFVNYKPTQQPFTNEKLNNVQNQNLIENNAPSLNLNNTPQIGQNNNNLVGQTFKSSMPLKPQFPNTTTSTVQNPTSNINGPNLAPFNSINPQPNMQAPQTSSAMPTNYHQIPKNSVPVPAATQPAAQSNQAAFPNISAFQNQPQPKINGTNLPPSSSATQPPQSRPGMPTNYNQLPTNNVPVPSVNSAMVPNQSATQSPITTNPNQFKATLHNNRYPTQPKNPQNLFPAGNNYSQPQSNQNYHPSQPFPQQNQFQQFPQQTQQQFPPQTTQFAPQTPAYPQPSQFNNVYQNQSVYGNSVTQSGFNKLWGSDNYDLLQSPNILPPKKEPAPRIHLGQQQLDEANCTSDIFRCTMTRIPESNSLLQKSRLPLGILIHPFKDLNHLPVIQCNVIVRCRACRTYINPFVYFVDCKRWKCNLCYRVNELPDEFQFDPVSKSYGDPTRRPEIKSSTIEYIAPAEYMLRPPQPAVYLFLLDVSRLAVESGYLNTICNILIEEMDNLPGDSRTQIGFITFDSVLHFFSLAEGLSKPHEMTVLDVDDVFLPTPDNLLVNLKDHKELVVELLSQLPNKYSLTYDTNSALGAALQAAFKMMSATGGRVTVFQAALPNVGPGALTAREDPSQRTSTQEVQHLNPANDFYKRLALECSGQQIAVDLFVVNSQYVDMATISGISRFSGGSVQHFPLFKATRPVQNEALSRCFRRYLVRKIGFEAVMRIRCTRGLSIHTFHGNFFVRSTDLLSLPNVNPDAGFGMQVSIDENLSDVKSVCFQAALLYTSSKGERRIRVHTLCMPICATLHDVINSADQECIVGLLSKMAVDRSMQSSLSDAREAFINVAIDILSSYKLSLNMSSGTSGLMAPECLRLLPLFISALLKSAAFRTGTSTRLDDRVKAMIDMKTKPLSQLMQLVYPDLYPVHDLEHQEVIINSDEETIPLPPRLQLTARCLDSKGAFLLDAGDQMILLVCPNVAPTFLTQVLGVPNYNAISEVGGYLPVLDNPHNMRLHMFLNYLNEEKPYAAPLQIIKDNSPNRAMFFERLIEDRVENALSYHEFLQHIKTQIK